MDSINNYLIEQRIGGVIMEKNYLSEEEQYKPILNNEEIDRIKDPELRAIRWKYWHWKTDAFLDEHRISDQELMRLTDRWDKMEQEELAKYRLKHGN
jgi:hypothetical protein